MKRIFLTGASSGIGRAAAEALVTAGHQVWGTSRDIARLPARERFTPVALDLASADSIAAAFRDAERDANGFDVLVNNAGSGQFGPAEFLSREQLLQEFQVLVFGQLQLMQLALPAMRERRSGLIINVSSLASRLPLPFMSSYSAAKAALALFTMSMNLELRTAGVRFVDLQPADIRTSFNDAVTRLEADVPEYRAALENTWRVADHNMQTAPGPELIARHIVRLVQIDNPPPRVTLGGAFQAKIAPFLLRFLPVRTQLWGLKKYYGI
jgi:NAD(P)-dependent dehydrogenase (short-subunit alcohol dehydrogenase family)